MSVVIARRARNCAQERAIQYSEIELKRRGVPDTRMRGV
jgi:hypothetical protein